MACIMVLSRYCLIERVKVKHLHRFFSSDASGGIILIIAAALAMVLANTDVTSGLYHAFLETPVQLRSGRWKSTRTCCCGSTMR
jgi:Na+/H+ antiporter NhaA